MIRPNRITIGGIIFVLFTILTFGVPLWAADLPEGATLEKKRIETRESEPQQELDFDERTGGIRRRKPPGCRSVDLVVSKVRMIRGIFGGERKIQITPYIMNMCQGRTSTRIKILLDGLGMAEWLEGGIGPKEEKSGGSLYVTDVRGSRSLRFSVEVDNNNDIPETNEDNNRCENVTFSAFDKKSKVHRCR